MPARLTRTSVCPFGPNQKDLRDSRGASFHCGTTLSQIGRSVGYDGEVEELQPQVCITSKRVCPASKHQPMKNSSSCNWVWLGRFMVLAASNATDCTECPAGRHQSGAKASSCIECPRGKYQRKANASSCMTCSCTGKGEFCHSREGCMNCCTAGGKPSAEKTCSEGRCSVGSCLGASAFVSGRGHEGGVCVCVCVCVCARSAVGLFAKGPLLRKATRRHAAGLVSRLGIKEKGTC
jgi:hypothetical protein